MSVFSLPSGHDNHFREQAFRSSFLVSMVIHVLIVAVAGGMTLFRMTGMTYAPSYTVDLVSLPPSHEVSRPGKAAAVPSGPEPKTAPKKEAVPAADPIKKPVSRPPAQPSETRPAEIKPSGGDEAAAFRLERKRRIEELEQEARQLYESFTTGEKETPGTPVTKNGPDVGTESGPGGSDGSAHSTGSTGSFGSGAQGTGGPSPDLRFRLYNDLIWSKIRSSWFPQGVAAGEKLLTVVGIRIAPDGKIEDYWIEKRSGNDYYDQSAIRAIRKSSPLPELPKDLGSEPHEVGVNFRYPE